MNLQRFRTAIPRPAAVAPPAKKYRLCFAVTNDLTYDRRMQRICSTLAEAGFEVELVGRVLPHSLPLAERNFSQRRLRCRFKRGAGFYAEYNLRLFSYLLFHRCHVIGACDVDTLLAGWLAARLRQRPVVFDAHEYFTETPEVVRRPRVRRIWAFIADKLVPRVDAAYTVGAALAEIFQQQHKVVFEVIRNVPYRLPFAPAPLLSTPKVILYQGVLNEGRGLEAAIAAMESLPEAEFWLAGEGDLSQVLRHLAAASPAASRIRFLGYVLPQDLPALTRQAYIGINLLENKGLNYYYSLANKCFDYIQSGVPALHPDFPEYRSLNREHEIGVLVGELSPTSVAQALKRLLHDEAYYRHLQANCYAAAQHYVWENEAAKLIRVFSEL